MAPIRVGIIGLSAEPGVGVGKWGIAAHLASLLPSPNYDIVAVCNSSVESARRSIEFNKLPGAVKAYGNPEDLAKDPNVDFVTVSIAVEKRFAVAKPALLAKKQVFVEWPLGRSTAEAEELYRLAKEANLKTAVGAQFRADPWIAKTKQLIESGVIGRVTSSELSFCANFMPPDTWMEEAAYYLDFESGGNDFHVGFAHMLDAFIYLLGDFATVKSTLAIQHPVVKTISTKTGQIVNPARRRTAPDHILVQGTLESGAVASITSRKSLQPADGLGLRWLIMGPEGEIELATGGAGPNMGSDPRTLRLRVGKEEGEAKVVDWEEEEPEHVKRVSFPGANTARVYEAFAQNKDRFADFEAAVKLHRLLDRIAKDAGFM